MVVSAPPKFNNICEHKLNVGHKHKNFSSTFSLEKSKLNMAHIHNPKYKDTMLKGKKMKWYTTLPRVTEEFICDKGLIRLCPKDFSKLIIFT